MFSITKEDLEFGGFIALLAITILTPIISFIATLLFGYFDPKRRLKPTWAQKRNWVLIITCITWVFAVLFYEIYTPFLPGPIINGLTIGHLFFCLCFLVIAKELLNIITGYNLGKRVMFTLGVNTVCLGMVLMLVN